MEIWFVVLIVAEIALFLLYVYFLKRYPVDLKRSIFP